VKVRPKARAIFGTRLPEVRPGRVLVSRRWAWPSEKMKSERDRVRQPRARWALAARRWTSEVISGETRAGQISSLWPGSYLAE